MIKDGQSWIEGDNMRFFDENEAEQEILNKSDVDDTPVNGATSF